MKLKIMADSSSIKQETYNVENTLVQMRKGFLEFPVLLLIKAEARYVPDLVQQLKAANLLVVEGTLYPLLSRLKRFGLVEYDWKESKSGPPRKYYAITSTGEAVLAQLETSWSALDSSINTLIENSKKEV